MLPGKLKCKINISINLGNENGGTANKFKHHVATHPSNFWISAELLPTRSKVIDIPSKTTCSSNLAQASLTSPPVGKIKTKYAKQKSKVPNSELVDKMNKTSSSC